MLLKLARESIEMKLENNAIPDINEKDLSENVKMNCGAFVTLNKNNQLRGCIGNFTSTEPLYKVVQEMAVAAAFSDFRFAPVVKEELSKIDIEISVLTPLKKISSIDDFKLGEQGIYMIKGTQGGTFLPQVAELTDWNKEEFLGHCARDKAEIGFDDFYDIHVPIADELFTAHQADCAAEIAAEKAAKTSGKKKRGKPMDEENESEKQDAPETERNTQGQGEKSDHNRAVVNCFLQFVNDPSLPLPFFVVIPLLSLPPWDEQPRDPTQRSND